MRSTGKISVMTTPTTIPVSVSIRAVGRVYDTRIREYQGGGQGV